MIDWTPELEQEILDWISEGKTLREFCRQSGKPSYSAVYDHQNLVESFKQRFACARESGEDVIAQECLEIADDGSNDWMERSGKGEESKGWQENGEHILRSRLRVDTRLKLLAKWNPKKYGERIQQDVNVNLALSDRLKAAEKRLESWPVIDAIGEVSSK